MSNNTWTVRFALESYWQAGSGRGGGALLDALAHKDADGLPYLPGRTVKGLLRDAVYRLEHWGHAPEKLTHCLFGSIGVEEGVIRLETDPGALGFSDARLPDAERAWLAAEENQALRRALFRHLSSTAVDNKTGTAKSTSLRSIEVAIPVTLEARMELICPDALIPGGENIAANKWSNYLKQALPLIRAAGVNRSRGLGRVKVTMTP